MQPSLLKKVIYFFLALTPLTLWVVSDGKILNLFPTDSVGLFFPFISGKNLLFRLFIEIAFVSWLLLAYIDKSYRIQKNYLSLAIFIFTGVIFAADLLGVNKTSSFFSGFERMEGFVGHIHYVLYFIVLTSVIKTKEEWKKLAKWFFVASVLVGFFGLLQLSGSKDFVIAKHYPRFSLGCAEAELPEERCLLWTSHAIDGGGNTLAVPRYWYGMSQYFPIHQGGRIDSTLGNPAYFAIASVYFLFLALLGAVTAKTRNMKVFLVVALANAFLLIFTATRSAVLGLFAGLVIAGALFLFERKKFFYEWILLFVLVLGFAYSLFFAKSLVGDLFVLLLVVVAASTVKSFFVFKVKSKKVVAAAFLSGILLIGLFGLVRKTDFVTQNPFLSRFANISASDPTGNSRIMVWKMALQGFKERPILGWGQDNFSYVFAKYHDPNMYAQEPWFDRCHNVFFDWLIAAGILGLVSHLALYFFAALLTSRATLFSEAEKVSIYGLLVAQFVNNLFIFDNLASYLLFYALLAYISSVYSSGNKDQKDISLEKQKEWLVPVGILLLCVLSLSSVILPYFANKATIRGLVSYRGGDQFDEMRLKRNGFEDAVTIGSVGRREIREQAVSTAAAVIGADGSKLSPEMSSTLLEEKKKWFTLVSGLAQTDIADYPDDLRIVEVYGNFYLRIGDMENAGKLLTEAHKLAPHRQRTSFSLMQYYLLAGNFKDAYTLAQGVYKDAPEYEVARKAYTSISLRIGEKEFTSAVAEIHADKQKIVFPESVSAELIGVKDKKTIHLYINALKADYPEKADELNQAEKALLSGK